MVLHGGSRCWAIKLARIGPLCGVFYVLIFVNSFFIKCQFAGGVIVPILSLELFII